ncbi:hypothetical protein LEP1GSC060_2298 [Leptospira weilii serovar Ranarum str. ICFT]|uniref:Uncharacterized protein n=1 Tax=Leptospira weilii serovar Ranarum str. ICFT TaxID=1218598 RepID=N1WQ05_9LEPT|nr:hypothetical protein LEP1GSC060_2298 [Leptospira weilii serovar Ranarum str. ICFT]
MKSRIKSWTCFVWSGLECPVSPNGFKIGSVFEKKNAGVPRLSCKSRLYHPRTG